MNLETLKWDPELLSFFGVSANVLPEIRSSSEVYGRLDYGGCEWNVPIAGCLGDQQAALVGHQCYQPGIKGMLLLSSNCYIGDKTV